MEFLYISKNNFLKKINFLWNEDRWIQTYFSQYKYPSLYILHHWFKSSAVTSLEKSSWNEFNDLRVHTSYNLFPRGPKSFPRNKLCTESDWCSFLFLICLFYECCFNKDKTIYLVSFCSLGTFCPAEDTPPGNYFLTEPPC